MSRKIIVLGGSGTFGRLIAAELATFENVALVIAARDRTRAKEVAQPLGATVTVCDVRDPASIARALADAFLVIHAAGPFVDNDHLVARLSLQAGAHYLDIADGRAHVTTIGKLDAEARARGLYVCVGASTTPGVTSAMVHELAQGEPLDRIHSILSPGNRNPRGAGTLATILAYMGRPIALTVEGKATTRYGWGDGETVNLPAPIYRRRVFTAQSPELELFPQVFGVQTSTFKAGLELAVMNFGVSVLAQMFRRGVRLESKALASPLTQFSYLLYLFGTTHGVVAVWIKTHAGAWRKLAYVAERNGPFAAVAPAILLARSLVEGRETRRGAFYCIGQVTTKELIDFLSPRGFVAVRGDATRWVRGR